ncbi:MAG: hypothetical protein CM1200mP30_27360 [Pseudomonadota bacterium]|nr:MAG: hypothetical protein CM1200mP30_27360 [Pseudomonadota bacterium]
MYTQFPVHLVLKLQVLIFHFRLTRGGVGDSKCPAEPSGNFLSKSGHHPTAAAKFCWGIRHP